MTALRRLAYAALGLAYVHVVFGAIVRITGSGMGCGDHWPKCHGRWFPPLDRMDLVIEITHRWLAAGLTATIVALLAATFLRRREPRVAGPGGVLRPAALSTVLVVSAALFGAIVVKLELTNPHVIVVHFGIAMALLGALVVTAMRAGGLAAPRLREGDASARTHRGARLAAGLALAAVLLGALTANVPGANGACVGFPHCREIASGGEALALHLTHRVVGFLLLFHAIGLVVGVRRRGEHALVRRAAVAVLALVVAQILVAAVLVELRLPAIWRSLHMAVGTAVWLSTFLFAMYARRGARGATAPAGEHDLRGGMAAATTAAAMLVAEPRPARETPPGGAPAIVASASPSLVDEDAVERSIVALAAFDAADVVLPEPESYAAVDDAPLRLGAAASHETPDADTAAADVTAAELAIVEQALAEAASVAEEIASVELPDDTLSEPTPEEAIAAEESIIEHAIVVADSLEEPAYEVFPVEPDAEEEPGPGLALAEPDEDYDEEPLDVNAAALAQLEQLEQLEQVDPPEPLELPSSPPQPVVAEAAEVPDAADAAPGVAAPENPLRKRPPTLAVIIARGADF